MRLKTFIAPTMQEAMRMVRAEMGEEAVIVSTLQNPKQGGVRITAALERAETRGPCGAAPQPPARPRAALLDRIRCALEDHGTPEPIVARLANAARISGADTAEIALAAALDDCFRFAPLSEKEARKPVMLIGAPGAGKTVTAAKIAARATLGRHGAALISTDTVRPGGVEQLQGFATLLEVPLQTARTPAELRDAVADCRFGDMVIIDTAGVNPYGEDELEEIGALIAASGAEPVLVLAAGGDARESAMLAEAFGPLGAGRLLLTRLDLARRLGSLLAAADAARLRFSSVSTAPGAAAALVPLNPVSLARLLLPGPAAILPTSKTESVA
jgi:flagellar biosynthesis protein FlhF